MNDEVTGAFRFAVSLRFRTRNIDPQEICRRLNMQPRRMWAAGDAKTLPTGEAWKGVHEFGYCTFPLEREKDEGLIGLLDRALDGLMEFQDLFDQVRDDGGQA